MQGDRVELPALCQREIAFQSTGYLFSFTSPFFLRPRPVGGLILRLFDGGAEGSWSTACLDARARLAARAAGGLAACGRWRRSYLGAGASCRGVGDGLLRVLRRTGEGEPLEGPALLGPAGEHVAARNSAGGGSCGRRGREGEPAGDVYAGCWDRSGEKPSWESVTFSSVSGSCGSTDSS